MSSLQTRVISALLAVGLMGLSFWALGSTAVYVLIYFAISLCQWEYAQLCLPKARNTLKYGFLVISQYYLLQSLPIAVLSELSPMKLGVQYFIFICFFGILSDKEDINEIRNDIFASCFGYIYLSVIPGLLILTLTANPRQLVELFFFLLLTVFAGDVFAYFSGLWLGNKKILPSISPKKTVVGCIGGLMGSVALGSIYAHYLLRNTNPWAIAGCCLVIGLYAQTGDFLESLLKRLAGKKDSGKILPGHGGFLDRLDGVLFAIPALYWFFY
ncbi:MAG: phosphatidate cytidylyltransferase [Bdellovibrionota bacterium]|nr:hypothetical protein [Pseudobdellovibrionaceae bacterium]|tara:strand:- start:21225 stop:22037 length:813 start_codon:yes stop_codon:yes gene_type:complete